jgi:hypothetical protein
MVKIKGNMELVLSRVQDGTPVLIFEDLNTDSITFENKNITLKLDVDDKVFKDIKQIISKTKI